jgi:hypothetical protein
MRGKSHEQQELKDMAQAAAAAVVVAKKGEKNQLSQS